MKAPALGFVDATVNSNHHKRIPAAMRLSRVLAVMILLTAAAVLCGAQPLLSHAPRSPSGPATPPATANAAVAYRAAFSDLGEWSDAEWEIVGNWRQSPLDQPALALLKENAGALAALRRGSQLQACDWGLDLSKGPLLLLPDLNHARALAQLACLQARLDEAQHDDRHAIDSACDVLVFARRIGEQPFVISSLIQYGIDAEAIDALGMILNHLDAASVQWLKHRLDSLPADVSLADQVKSQTAITVNWALRQIQKAGPNPNWAQVWAPLKTHSNIDYLALCEAGPTPDAVIRQVRQLSQEGDQIAQLIAARPPPQEFDQKCNTLGATLAANPFAGLLFSDYDQSYLREAQDLTRLVMLRAAIAVVQHGPDAVQQFQDPIFHQPIDCLVMKTGFSLASAVPLGNGALTLNIGSDQPESVP